MQNINTTNGKQITCPRCQFKQPLDQYCASCGLDILSFKPTEKSLINRLFSNGFFLILVIVGLGFGLSFFIAKNSKSQKWIQKITSAQNIAQRTKNTAALNNDQNNQKNFDQTTLNEKNTNQNLKDETSDSQGINTDSSLTSSLASSLADSKKTISLAVSNPGNETLSDQIKPVDSSSEKISISDLDSIMITMIEVEIDHISRLAANPESVTTYDNDDVKAFTSFQNIDTKLFKKLLSSKLKIKETDDKNTAVQKIWVGRIDAASNYERGLKISFNEMKELPHSFKFNISLDKIHPNDKISINFPFELLANQRLILFGSSLLNYFELEQEFLDIYPFQILKSADYKNLKTTFAIIIEFKK